MQWDWQFITSIIQILIIDVVLSGDNAVVIALAAHRLPPQQRKVAILCGAAGAIVLRVVFTWILAQLLGIPLLRFGGGIVLRPRICYTRCGSL
jgi:predicted tellurium resistance membrane protein TerC